MSEVLTFLDWGDDFRYAEERRRVSAYIKSLAAEGGFTHGEVQEMFIKNRYRTMFGLYLTVHLQKPEWLNASAKRYVPVRIWFTEDCTLEEKKNNPDWYPEVVVQTE